MNTTVITVAAIQALATVLVAAISVVWGKQALALKDEVIKAKQDQLAQLQQLKDETIRAKDVQVEQLRGLTTPQLVEHFKGLGEIYDGALSNVRKQLHEKDEALKAGELDAKQRQQFEHELMARHGQVRELRAALKATQQTVTALQSLMHSQQAGIGPYGVLVGTAGVLTSYPANLMPTPNLVTFTPGSTRLAWPDEPSETSEEPERAEGEEPDGEVPTTPSGESQPGKPEQ